MEIVTKINKDKIILLIIKVFVKIVAVIETIMKKFIKINKRVSIIIMEIVLIMMTR